MNANNVLSKNGWQANLKQLENAQQWDAAIELMQSIIKTNPDDVDAYLAINYLLMNLLVEERHDETKHDFYESLLKHYFDESYAKFSNNPEYLFFTGVTGWISEWFFNVELDDLRDMFRKARLLEPENILYQYGYYSYTENFNGENKRYWLPTSQEVLQKNAAVRNYLQSKGAVGEYVLGLMRCDICNNDT